MCRCLSIPKSTTRGNQSSVCWEPRHYNSQSLFSFSDTGQRRTAVADFLDLTKPPLVQDTLPTEVRHCLDQFSESFNREDLSGMDEQCHFPHYLIGEESVTVWNSPGQVPADFFDQLKASVWAYTSCEKCEPILITEKKIHILWSYARRESDGKIISLHENTSGFSPRNAIDGGFKSGRTDSRNTHSPKPAYSPHAHRASATVHTNMVTHQFL